MSFRSSLETKQRVKQAIDIVELVGKYVCLRRQGRRYAGLCPWHDDTRPSLQVDPQRQSFRCWVCDIGGDVFSFVMKMDGLTFPEALALLAERAGIPLEPARPEPRTPGVFDKRDLYRAMAWAEGQYHECLLRDPEAEPARRYLQDRRITAQSIGRFRLGFCPNRWDWTLRRADSQGISPDLLEVVGLLVRPEAGGRPYERFRGRLLFPIRDVQGRPVGLGGRVLPELGTTSPAKYINSPETPLFRKSEQLYGLDLAQHAIRKTRSVLVMEGYTDAIVAHQFGFDNAVAVLGTALGEQHVRILKRLADRIVLVLDGDEAGQRRTNEVLELFVSKNVDLRIATLPEDLDPCDYLIRRGGEAFGEFLQHSAVDALEHAFRVFTRGIDLDRDVHGASEALERLVRIVAQAPRLQADAGAENRFRQERILQRLAASFRVPEQVVRERLSALRRTAKREAGRPPPGASLGPAEQGKPAGPRGAKPEPWERELLEILLQHPECVSEARRAIPPEELSSGPIREIYRGFCGLSDAGERPTFQRLMLEFDDPAVQSLLIELDQTGAAKRITAPRPLLEELFRTYRAIRTTRQHPVQAGRLRQQGLDETQQIDLLQQIIQRERARHGISEPTEG
ncbi:MAG: DNA primase [Thermoguttaceae bacterium]